MTLYWLECCVKAGTRIPFQLRLNDPKANRSTLLYRPFGFALPLKGFDLCRSDHSAPCVAAPCNASINAVPTRTPLPLLHPPLSTAHRVTSSGYSYRSEIKRLVELLGGSWSESFSRRNTHLLVSRAEGTKYEAAGRWGVVCLRVEWLLDCALQGQVCGASGGSA